MARNVFIRGTALTDVRGRIRYASSPDKQEKLQAFVDNMPKGGWLELSKYSQKQAALYKPGKKTCEARELIIALPNEMARFKSEELAIRLRKDFSETYGVPCAVAIHWNTIENNYHAHLIFSERPCYLKQQGGSIATRNTFFNSEGKRSTKKECVDELGNLKPGCRLVKKGEALSEGSMFGTKKNIFAQEEWMREEKKRLASFFNDFCKDGQWKVYDWKTDPHFPYLRIKKGDPAWLNAWRERENEWRREYNKNIDKLLESKEITKEQAIALKKKEYEFRARLRAEKQKRKEIWMRWYERRLRRETPEERQRRELNKIKYTKSGRKRGMLELTVILCCLMAGYDMIEKKHLDEINNLNPPTEKKNKPSEQAKKEALSVQKMMDDMYAAIEETKLKENLEDNKENIENQITMAEKIKRENELRGSNFNDKDKDRVNLPEGR